MFRATLDDSKVKQLGDLTKEWQERFLSVRRLIISDATKEYLGVMKSRIPDTGAYREYRKSLTLFQVGSSPVGYGVRIKPKKRGISSGERSNAILIVRSIRKSKNARLSPTMRVLIKFNPWTQSTLPCQPDPAEGVLVVQRVGQADVLRVSRKRNADRAQWEKAIARAGVSVGSKSVLTARSKVYSDLDTVGLTLEFGLGREQAHPHWRYALREMAASLKKLKVTDDMARAMTDPKYLDWKKWGIMQWDTLGEKDVEVFKEFSEKVATALR